VSGMDSFDDPRSADLGDPPPMASPFPPLLALESIRDAFYVVDADWRIVFFNACAERHFGRPRSDVIGLTVWQAFASAAGSPFDEPFKAAMRERRVARIEAESVRGDGRWVEVEASPCGTGMCLQVRDITERKRIEMRLLEREAKLRDADRRKDEFLAMLAHELRNPLAPLTNVLRLLGRSAALGESEQGLLAVAERQRAQLARLVDDLLDVSRITRGKIALRCEPMSVPSAVRDAIESVRSGIEARGQRVGLELDGRPADIVADPARIAQILENLLHNASKYTAAGGTIRVVVAERDDTVEIRVEDDGIGIDPANLERLFEPFAQLDTSLERSTGGLGIGLALVRRLAELHGGTAAAASEGLGRGARFSVRLPRRAVDAP
jgi:PAS domain S-box-containing protein